ncbi:MAG: hypothetical protein KME55_36875 [Nostoc indistinguendum CM1-VF10]|jgi:hypothetical protein|nr:hypothetical protein [Nostoc indistinguendum CM1-VF10]
MTGRILACTIPASIPPPPANSTTAIGALSGSVGFLGVAESWDDFAQFRTNYQ